MFRLAAFAFLCVLASSSRAQSAPTKGPPIAPPTAPPQGWWLTFKGNQVPSRSLGYTVELRGNAGRFSQRDIWPPNLLQRDTLVHWSFKDTLSRLQVLSNPQWQRWFLSSFVPGTADEFQRAPRVFEKIEALGDTVRIAGVLTRHFRTAESETYIDTADGRRCTGTKRFTGDYWISDDPSLRAIVLDAAALLPRANVELNTIGAFLPLGPPELRGIPVRSIVTTIDESTVEDTIVGFGRSDAAVTMPTFPSSWWAEDSRGNPPVRPDSAEAVRIKIMQQRYLTDPEVPVRGIVKQCTKS